MKKIISITCLLITVLSFRAFSQSNITWTLKDKGEKRFFKTHTTFHSNFSGFKDKQESESFFKKINTNPEIASAQASNVDKNGNCDVDLVMRQPHDKMYYIGLAQKLGVDYIQYNGEKKTPTQILEQIRNKAK